MHTIEIGKIMSCFEPELSQFFLLTTAKNHPALTASLIPVSRRPETGKVMVYQGIVHIDCLKIVHTHNIQKADLPTIKQAVQSFLLDSSLSLNDFSVIRIDYCYNAIVSKEERKWLLPELQKLPHKSDYLRREHDYQTSVYYQSKSRVTQFYDKEAERQNKGVTCADYEKSVLRLEAQIKREHIKYRKSSKTNRVSNCWDCWVNWDMQRTYLLRSLKNVVYTGDYHTLDSASAIIRQSGFSSAKQNNLLEFLKGIHKSGWDAASVNRCYNTNRRYAKELTEMNINPILLPDDSPFHVIKNPFLPVLNL